jgi:hypothetical protein
MDLSPAAARDASNDTSTRFRASAIAAFAEFKTGQANLVFTPAAASSKLNFMS